MSLDERFEQLIAFLGSQLPAPVDQQSMDDGTLVFVGGSPAEVVVQLTATKVIVSEFAGAWRDSGIEMRPRRVGTLLWHRLPETPLLNALTALIKGAREMRLSRYQACASCGNSYPPEVVVDGVCAACAEPEPYRVH